jgi:hypothetical protein
MDLRSAFEKLVAIRIPLHLAAPEDLVMFLHDIATNEAFAKRCSRAEILNMLHVIASLLVGKIDEELNKDRTLGSLEHEMDLIACILAEPMIAGHVFADLHPGHFKHKGMGLIYEIMKKLLLEGGQITPEAVCEKISNDRLHNMVQILHITGSRWPNRKDILWNAFEKFNVHGDEPAKEKS